MGEVIVFLVTTLVSSLLVLLIKHFYFDRRFARNIPSAQPMVPILGHTPYFVRITTEKSFRTIDRLFSSVDRIAKAFLVHKMVLITNHPDVLQQLLTRTDLYDKPFFYDFFYLEHGLIAQRSGPAWKRNRRLLNPTFNTRILNAFIPLMDDCAKNYKKQLESLADGKTDINFLTHAGRVTLEMIFRTTMNCKLEGHSEDCVYFQNLEFTMNIVGGRMLQAHQYVERIFRMTSTFREFWKRRAMLFSFVDEIVSKRRREIEALDDKHRSNFMIFLDQLLSMRREDGSQFSDVEISEQIYTIIFAGQETTALTVSYACLLLGMYPEWQKKLCTEIRHVFFDRLIDAQPENLKQLELMEMVLKECLRLMPAVPLSARETTCPIELDGVQLPVGQILGISYYSLHRRKDFWGKTADQFDPERFLPEAVKNRHPYAYLPFSGGFRNCIGARYAMNSLKIMLVRILQDFEIKTELRLEDLRFKYEISIKLVGPHELQLLKRDLYS